MVGQVLRVVTSPKECELPTSPILHLFCGERITTMYLQMPEPLHLFSAYCPRLGCPVYKGLARVGVPVPPLTSYVILGKNISSECLSVLICEMEIHILASHMRNIHIAVYCRRLTWCQAQWRHFG